MAIQSAAIAATAFVVYALGLCRTIYVGDSGELVAAAATLGIPHPTGYPLYVLLGHIWITLLPIGSIALRMSLMSAVAASLAVGGFYALTRRLGLSALSGLTAAGLLAFAPSFWSQVNIQRVYALNALFVVAVTAAACEWYRTRRIRWLVLAAFVAGLGAANHTAMAIHGLAVGIFALLIEPSLLRRLHYLAACVGAGLLGLLPYAYLPLRSRQEPRLDWGDPDNLDRFLTVVLRKDFWDRAWVETPADWLIVLRDYLHGLGEESLWGGLLLAIFALLFAWQKRSKILLLPLLAMLANLWAVGLHGSRSDIFIWHRYYLPSYIMLFLLAAFGAEQIRRRWRPALLLLPLALLLIGYPKFDRSRYQVAESFSRALLDSMPPGARLAASDDNILFVLLYLHLAEGLRPDIHLIQQGIGGSELPNLRFDPDDDPLYFTHHPNWNVEGLEMVPIGLTFRTLRAGSLWPSPTLTLNQLDGADDPRVPKDYLTQNLIGHFHYMLGITYEQRDWPRAQVEFERAMQQAPRNDVLFYNLGLIYRRNGLLERAHDAFTRSVEINPRRLASNKPVRAADRLAEVERELDNLRQLEGELRQRPELDGLGDGDAFYHHRLADLLETSGSQLAAHGQRLLALESADASEQR